jgi:hypothetical protein
MDRAPPLGREIPVVPGQHLFEMLRQIRFAHIRYGGGSADLAQVDARLTALHGAGTGC